MHTISATGANSSGASAVDMKILGLHPVVVFDTDQRKLRWCRPRPRATTRPASTSTNQTRLEYVEVEDPRGAPARSLRGYGAESLDLNRTSGQQDSATGAHRPTDECKGNEGLSLFYTDFDRGTIEVQE
jgi:acyl-CoA dehydrogenase